MHGCNQGLCKNNRFNGYENDNIMHPYLIQMNICYIQLLISFLPYFFFYFYSFFFSQLEASFEVLRKAVHTGLTPTIQVPFLRLSSIPLSSHI